MSTTVTPSLVADLLQVLPQVAARAGIEAGRRLVEQQQPRAVQHACGQFDAAPQAAGKLFDQVARRSARPSRVEHFVGPRAQLAAAEAVQPAVVDDVFHHRQLLVDARRLETRRRAARRIAAGSRAQVVAEDVHLALLQRNQRREHAKERRLAAAVGAEDARRFRRSRR